MPRLPSDKLARAWRLVAAWTAEAQDGNKQERAIGCGVCKVSTTLTWKPLKNELKRKWFVILFTFCFKWQDPKTFFS
jgi:hypothetical protein